MASRYHSSFREKKVSAPRGPKPGMDGQAEGKGGLSEKTARWPSAGPAGPMPFNKKTKWNVVKQAAAKQGLC